MLTLYIDADACPVKDEALRVAARHDMQVYVVSNSYLRNIGGLKVELVVVSEGADEADNWIADNIKENDVFITADILLAQRCVEKGAIGTGPSGKRFTTENIGSAVAMRNLGAHLRETGESSGYNKPYSKRDRSEFLQTIEKIIQEIKRL